MDEIIQEFLGTLFGTVSALIRLPNCTTPAGFARRLYQLTYLFTYSMEHSPSWEAKRFPASQEIPRILWNPKSAVWTRNIYALDARAVLVAATIVLPRRNYRAA